MVVFKRRRPVRGEAEFHTGADSSTPAVVAGRCRSDNAACEDIIAIGDHGRAALSINERGVEGIARLSREQAERIHPRPIGIGWRKDAYIAAAQVGPIALEFQPEHPRVALKAITDLTTGNAARGGMTSVARNEGAR